ncbi:signal peptidase I [Vibrio intestinalis]|uniref:signal peptidase I n=1 Tax=Vibrio intestinalis TaxID=2933291 RepID=UPI0021A2D777|nr:signal peptidase I [Vibrio intestinalis]
MANKFSLFLVILTIVTGIVWCLEKLVFAKKRAAKLAEIEAQTNGLDAETIEKVKKQPWWVENSVSIFPVIAVVMLLRSFVYEPFQIPSQSMMPTLLVGDFILVEKYAYGLKDPVWRKQLIETGKPERGDPIVFKFPLDPNVDYIKRVIGLPGDIVRYSADKQICLQKKGETSCNPVAQLNKTNSGYYYGRTAMIEADEQLDGHEHKILINPARHDIVENYAPRSGVNEWVVPEGHYFVMGDNRDHSSDGRFWGFVPEANLVGKAVAIWISFERDRDESSILPTWVPTGVRFERIGGIN